MFFPLLTYSVKLPGSVYSKIFTTEEHPKNTTSQKKACELMTASEYKQ